MKFAEERTKTVQHGNGNMIGEGSFIGDERYRDSIAIGQGGYLSFSWHGNDFGCTLASDLVHILPFRRF
jgi:hypothetical protein